ncbi:MAG: glycosyl hydrolase family 28 protein [Ignavibacteria bacterium]|jgi:polygalacturonase
MKKIIIVILATLINIQVVAGSNNTVYNVADYRVAPDGITIVTKEIQQVIDECSGNGGGRVFFPAGKYLTGTLILKDNVYLEIGAGATILGSPDIRDYKRETPYTIYGKQSKNIGIIGEGTLDGNGESFWKGKQRPYIRPKRFILFEECQDVKIKDVKIVNSPNWNIELLFCDYVWIDGVSIISSRESPNTDGIDPNSSANVFITNCYIDTGDDAICPKSRRTRPTENVVVENCILVSEDAGIKLGTRSETPIRNFVFNNIIIRNTQYGIAFFAKDGGTFENIRFSNIMIETVLDEELKDDKPSGSYAIFFDIEKRTSESPMSKIQDIYLSDITIKSTDGNCMILGQPDQKIENIYMSNICYSQYKHKTFENNKKPRGVRSLTERAANDYSNVPSNFTFAYVKNLNIDRLTVRDYDKSGKYERHMILGKNVEEVTISGFKNYLATPNLEKAQMCFENSSGIKIMTSTSGKTNSPFLKLSGDKTSKVSLLYNDFIGLSEIVNTSEEVDRDEVYMNYNRK